LAIVPATWVTPRYAFALGFDSLRRNVSFFSLSLSPLIVTLIVAELEPVGKVSVPLLATKSLGAVAVPFAVVYWTVTGYRAGAVETVTTNESVVVPVFPSFFEALKITTLHWSRRSCRWFLSPQPLPGFVLVGVVVEVDVLVDVDVLVEVEVVVGVVVVVVEVDVVVGVVVVVVEVDVVVGVVVVVVDVDVDVGVVVVVVEVEVEQYWYWLGVVQYW